MCLTVFMSACRKQTEDTGSSETAGSETPSVPQIDLSEYTLIYPQSFDADHRRLVTDLSAKLNDAYGIRLKSKSDFVATEKQYRIETEDKEILIGNTNRLETWQTASEVKDGEYGIRIKGNKVVLYGTEYEAVKRVIDSFYETVMSNGSLAVASDYTKTVNYVEQMYPEGSVMHTVSTQYKIVYSSSNTMGEHKCASTLKDAIEQKTGKEIKMSANADGDKLIVVGADNSSVGYYDYSLSVSGEKILISAGSALALTWATDALVSALSDGSFKLENGNVSTVKFDEKYFNPIVNNIALFTPSWKNSFESPTWLHSLDEKAYAITAGAGSRITTKAHRGDCYNYPENSIEGIASCIYAGVDAIELDVRTTKDGIAVLMHDDTLTRTTNVEKFAGKNGNPTSMKVSDWTYEQLQSLSLLKGKSETSYKIPTLYEALKLCAGRIFVQVDDKSATFSNQNTDLYYIARATGSMECFFQHYGVGMLKIWAGKAGDAEFSAFVSKCETYLGTSGHSMRKVYWPNESPNRGTYTGYPLNEAQSEWDEMYSEGRRMFWTENPIALIKYIVNVRNQTASK